MAEVDLTLIDINKIGYHNLNQIKNNEKVDWWVEMGDKLIVSLNGSKAKLPNFTKVITTYKNVDLNSLHLRV